MLLAKHHLSLVGKHDMSMHLSVQLKDITFEA